MAGALSGGTTNLTNLVLGVLGPASGAGGASTTTTDGLLIASNAYLLVIAIPSVTAAGVGFHSAVTATMTNKPTPPAPPA